MSFLAGFGGKELVEDAFGEGCEDFLIFMELALSLVDFPAALEGAGEDDGCFLMDGFISLLEDDVLLTEDFL